MFIDAQDHQTKKSDFNTKFYFYLIERLHKEYKTSKIDRLSGIPSAQSINNVYDYFQNKREEDESIVIEEILRERKKNIVEKQIYSTYKAASYYVNMAKHKLNIVTEDNIISEDGKKLLLMKSDFFKLSINEQEFFFKRLIEVDSLMILTIPLFKKLVVKYKKEDYIELQLEFLAVYYNIRYSYFTKTSLGNYELVREYWIDSLKVLDKNLNIRKKYLDIIKSNDDYKNLYSSILDNFIDYEKTYFKSKDKYNKQKDAFEINYEDNINKGNADGGYVNLYDIKAGMRLSDRSFEAFLNEYNQKETKYRRIFFSNLVNSIDRRRRFEVKGVPVLKIKIKKI